MFTHPNFIILRSHNYINIYDPLHDSAEKKISNGEKSVHICKDFIFPCAMFNPMFDQHKYWKSHDDRMNCLFIN